jgi:hypothetical protein
MTSTVAPVAPLPMPPPQPELSTEARKRRRDILAQQRTTGIMPDVAISLDAPVTPVAEVSAKRQKVAEKEKSAKKPQMKYDPDEPMSKDEAAAWRREQRRKRNRESAAASRQRQRDRITELEGELGGWKSKFDLIMEKITQLEDIAAKKQANPEQSHSLMMESLKFVSPPTSPGHSCRDSHDQEISPIVSSSLVDTAKVTPSIGINQISDNEEQQQQQSDKMISRQAVKIPDAMPALPFLPPSDDLILPPVSCLSSSSGIKLEPIDSTLFCANEEQLPALMSDEENEDEFGEFLLDAVQWL